MAKLVTHEQSQLRFVLASELQSGNCDEKCLVCAHEEANGVLIVQDLNVYLRCIFFKVVCCDELIQTRFYQLGLFSLLLISQ